MIGQYRKVFYRLFSPAQTKNSDGEFIEAPIKRGRVKAKLERRGILSGEGFGAEVFEAVTNDDGYFEMMLWCDADSLKKTGYLIYFPDKSNGAANEARPPEKFRLAFEDGEPLELGLPIGLPADVENPAYAVVNELINSKISRVENKTNQLPYFAPNGEILGSPLALERQKLRSTGVDAVFDAAHLPILILETIAGNLTGLYEYALIPVDEFGFEQFGIPEVSVQRKQVVNKAIKVVAVTNDGRDFTVTTRHRRYRRKADANGVFSNNWVLLDDSSAFFITDNSDAAGVASLPPPMRDFAGGVRSRLDPFRTAQSYLQIPASVAEVKPAVWLSPRFNPAAAGTMVRNAESFGAVGGIVYADRSPKPTAQTAVINGISRPVWNFTGGECYLGTLGGQTIRWRAAPNYPRGLSCLRHDNYSSGVSFMLILNQTQLLANYQTLFRVRNQGSGYQNILFQSGANNRNNYGIAGNVGSNQAAVSNFNVGLTAGVQPEWNLVFFVYDNVGKTVSVRVNGVDSAALNVPGGEVWQTFIPEFFIGGDYHYGNSPCQFAEVILDDSAWDGTRIRKLENDFKREYGFNFPSATAEDEVIFDGGTA